LDESGVTKAQPAVVNVRSEHFVKKTFLRRDLSVLKATST